MIKLLFGVSLYAVRQHIHIFVEDADVQAFALVKRIKAFERDIETLHHGVCQQGNSAKLLVRNGLNVPQVLQKDTIAIQKLAAKASLSEMADMRIVDGVGLQRHELVN